MTETDTLITTPSGENVWCDSFEAQLHNLKSGSIECASLDESYADACGCSEPESFVPCSLCVGGDKVPFPEEELKGLVGTWTYILEPNCGALARQALLVHENSLHCRGFRALAQLCRCKPRAENQCTSHLRRW
jgi:hypothetical protein